MNGLAILAGAAILLTHADPAVVRTAGEPNVVQGQVGAGFQFGCPTGLSLKFRLATASSLQAGAGFGCANVLVFTGDYVLEMGNFFVDPKTLQMSWYIGGGGRLGTGDYGYYAHRYHHGADIGVRMPLGVEMRFPQMKPLEAFFEIAPGIEFVDGPWVTVDAAVGARFFF